MSAQPSLPAPPLPGVDDRWALFLDVDGTLLDFADHPDHVYVDSRLSELIEDLYGTLDGALALVSGRSLDDLDDLFSHPPWAMAGLHGLELRGVDGRYRGVHIGASRRSLVRDIAGTIAGEFPGVLVEDKGMAVALHCRTSPQLFERLRERVREVLPSLAGYEMQPGNMVIELKPEGMDKGSAVANLMSAWPFRGRVPVYVGDDLTDEHGFSTANLQSGLSIRVGSREPSLARYSLSEPAAARAWLFRVLHALKHGALSHAHSSGGNA
ncbi:trehalose-phosphatase [Dyella kyungheensis]|uniref:Trehalose 6-phosphate phosphatase n=1 Tax=Dyella kyungheensis TaxID=1242174 RepID=A0ABS2JVW7_9GAMM|nr:trehalose-phosphatase [Dyella kyungheensis]MBM7122623.1 trehalose-phosphatase [Dyella kyungheensis]